MTDTRRDELVVPYDPSQVQKRLDRNRRRMRSRIISLVITLLLLGGIYAWRRHQGQAGDSLPVYLVLLGVSVVWLAVTVVLFLLARRHLARVGEGTAVRLGPPGVQVGARAARWSDVASVGAARGRRGRSPVLRLTRTDGGTSEVPFDEISVFPATLDSAARAYSGGRHGVDLEQLDR